MTGSAVRTVLVVDEPFPAQAAIKLQLDDPASTHNVKALVRSSPDGRSAIEVGIAGVNIVIQTVTLGGSASVKATAAHGLASGQPFTLEVRLIGSEVSAYLNGSETAAVTWDATDTFAAYRRWGWVSAVANARVLRAEVCTLEPNTRPRRDVLVAVAEGRVFEVNRTDDGEYTAAELPNTGFDPNADVSLTEFLQKIYGLDGQNVTVIDLAQAVATDRVQPLSPADASGYPWGIFTAAGKTRMTLGISHRGRWDVTGDPQDPQNVWQSYLGAPDYWATDDPDDQQGHAWAISTSLAGRIGQPVTCLVSATKATMIIGCTGQIWEFLGDFTTGLPDLNPLSLSNGIVGKDAAVLANDGRVVCLSSEGLLLIDVGSAPVPLSKPVLTNGIEISRASLDSYIIHLCRDAKRETVYVFLTPRDGSVGVHFAYVERVGQYRPGAGGFFPDTYPASVGPTCSCAWLGEVVLGTWDGRLMAFDELATSDDGDAINFKATCALLDEPDTAHDTELCGLAVTLGEMSNDVQFRVYGGINPEHAYLGSDRWLLLRATASRARTGRPFTHKVRAAAMTLEIWDSDVDSVINLERVEVLTRPCRGLTRRTKILPVTPPICTPPAAGSASAGASFASGPGFGGSPITTGTPGAPPGSASNTGSPLIVPGGSDVAGTGSGPTLENPGDGSDVVNNV